MHVRLRVLSRRATLINRAITLCVLCGLLVSLVVATLFVFSVLVMFSQAFNPFLYFQF